MDYKITSTAKANRRARRGGFTLVEMMLAVGIGSIVLAVVTTFYLFAARSFWAMGNYVVLDAKSRNALDVLSRDIRQANSCSTNSFSASNLTLLMVNPTNGQPYTVNYNYDTNAQAMTRTYRTAGGVQTAILLTNCTSFAFTYYQRNPTNGAWEAFPLDAGRADMCKLVQVDWVCARRLFGSLVNSENIESAKVVIRKE